MIYSLTYSRDFIYFQFFMGYSCSTRNFRVRVIFLISAKFWLGRGANHGLSLDGATLFRGCCNINQTKCEKSLIQSNFQTKQLHFHFIFLDFKRTLRYITYNLSFITKKNNFILINLLYCTIFPLIRAPDDFLVTKF